MAKFLKTTLALSMAKRAMTVSKISAFNCIFISDAKYFEFAEIMTFQVYDCGDQFMLNTQILHFFSQSLDVIHWCGSSNKSLLSANLDSDGK